MGEQRKPLKVWAFACGCVAEGRRDGPRVEKCPQAMGLATSGCVYSPKPPRGARKYRA